MSANYQQECDVAVEAVRRAALVCRSVQSRIDVSRLEKQDRSPVTVADFASQALICRTLKAAFPDDPIIGEEDSADLQQPENAQHLQEVHQELQQQGIAASSAEICEWIDHGSSREFAERFWTLDPIDGTKGFLRGEQYAISLALIVKGNIELGLLACPNLAVSPPDSQPAGCLFQAVRGQGAGLWPLDETADLRAIWVSETSEASSARFCESVESAHSSHSRSAAVAETLGITAWPVRIDSQAKYAVVARGEGDIYLRLPSRRGYTEKIWDHAAGVLLVEEAGGRVSDIAGRNLEFTHGELLAANRGVVVTNGHLHQTVLDALEATPEIPL